jgi:hypothetical protein
MENTHVVAVFERLKKALHITSDAELADQLGLSYAAFNKRKIRGSLPEIEVETLIEREGISRLWVMSEEGPMYEGGELDEKRTRDFHELIEQIEAMALHSATRKIVEPIIKGVVWGDAHRVESVVESIADVSTRERAVLEAYRLGGHELRSAMELLAGIKTAKSSPRVKQTFHGSVGQVVDGDLHTSGAVNINMPASPIKKSTAKGGR